MRRSLVLIICLMMLGNVQVFCQQVKIGVDNPEPRKGQEFFLSIENGFLKGYLEDYLGSQFQVKMDGFLLNEGVRMKVVPKDTGVFTIGPLEFTFNDSLFTTNQIRIHVLEVLEKVEGVWVRYFKNDGEEFVVIEQRMLATPGTDLTKWEPNDKLTGLVTDTGEGILFFRSSMNSKSETVPSSTPGAKPDLMTYSYKMFRVNKESTFKGNFQLRREHFVNLPDDVVIPDIVIE